MKTAIAAAGNTRNAQIDQRFARAEYIIVFDDTGEISDTFQNSYKDAEHGAGTGVAAWMNENNIDVIIAATYGPKASKSLLSMGKRLYIADTTMTVNEAYSALQEGSLKEFS